MTVIRLTIICILHPHSTRSHDRYSSFIVVPPRVLGYSFELHSHRNALVVGRDPNSFCRSIPTRVPQIIPPLHHPIHRICLFYACVWVHSLVDSTILCAFLDASSVEMSWT